MKLDMVKEQLAKIKRIDRPTSQRLSYEKVKLIL